MYRVSLDIFNVHVQQPRQTYRLHLPAEIRDIVMTSYPFFKMAATASQFYFRFRFRDFADLGRSKYTCIPNFGDKPQSTAEILLLSVSENKRPPCWNFTSGLDFHVCITIGMSFCICPPNFVQILPSVTDLYCHVQYPRRWPQRHNSTFGFVFGDFANLQRSKSTRRPNLCEKS